MGVPKFSLILKFSFRMILRKLSKLSLATGGLFTAYAIYNKGDLNSLSVVRFGRAAVAAGLIAADYKWNLYNLDSEHSDYEPVLSKLHLRSAQRILDVCRSNGGCFIKVGQHIGGLDYLLPTEYVNTMKILHQQAPESNVNELFETIETDLKCKIGDIFKHIENKPLGTASLAQVHKAILHDGSVVAVKIQHPKVKERSHVDIETIAFFVNLMHYIFPSFDLVWLAEETRKNLPIELDFINEGKNAEKVAGYLKKFPFVKIPKIYWQFTSDRVLTMEYCEGERVDDAKEMKKNKINVNLISKRIGVLFSEMIFTHGFVHSDPHPGNVLINPIRGKKAAEDKKSTEFQIILIDHGLYQTLSKKFRYDYAHLWLSILNRDIERLKEATRKFDSEIYYGLLACIVTGRSWNSIIHGVDKVKYSAVEGEEIKSEAAKYLREIAALLNKVPRQMLLLLKTNDLIRGTETCLNTRNSSSAFIHMSQCCVKLIHSYERETNSLVRKSDNNSYLIEFNIPKIKFLLFSYLCEYFELFKIFLYKFYLTAINS